MVCVCVWEREQFIVHENDFFCTFLIPFTIQILVLHLYPIILYPRRCLYISLSLHFSGSFNENQKQSVSTPPTILFQYRSLTVIFCFYTRQMNAFVFAAAPIHAHTNSKDKRKFFTWQRNKRKKYCTKASAKDAFNFVHSHTHYY